MVPRWRFLATFLRPVFAASRMQRISDLHSKFALHLTANAGRNAATIPRYLIKNLKYGSSCTHPFQLSGPNFALICGAKYRHNTAVFDKFSNLGAPAPTPFTDHNQFGMQEYIQVRPDLFIASPLAKTRNSTAFSTSTFCGGAT